MNSTASLMIFASIIILMIGSSSCSRRSSEIYVPTGSRAENDSDGEGVERNQQNELSEEQFTAPAPLLEDENNVQGFSLAEGADDACEECSGGEVKAAKVPVVPAAVTKAAVTKDTGDIETAGHEGIWKKYQTEKGSGYQYWQKKADNSYEKTDWRGNPNTSGDTWILDKYEEGKNQSQNRFTLKHQGDNKWEGDGKVWANGWQDIKDTKFYYNAEPKGDGVDGLKHWSKASGNGNYAESTVETIVAENWGLGKSGKVWFKDSNGKVINKSGEKPEFQLQNVENGIINNTNYKNVFTSLFKLITNK